MICTSSSEVGRSRTMRRMSLGGFVMLDLLVIMFFGPCVRGSCCNRAAMPGAGPRSEIRPWPSSSSPAISSGRAAPSRHDCPEDVMPTSRNASIARIRRTCRQGDQHAWWSQVCEPALVEPSDPKGTITEQPTVSKAPHHAHLPGSDGAGFRFIHSITHDSNALASASARGNPPSNSAMPTLSSQKARHSSADQPSFEAASSARISAL